MRTQGCPAPTSSKSPAGSGSPGGPARVLTPAGGPRPSPVNPRAFEGKVKCHAGRFSTRAVRVGESGAWAEFGLVPQTRPLTHTLASSGRGSSARPCGSVKRRLVARTECPQHLAGAHAKPAPRTRGSGRAQPPSGRAPPSHAPALTHAQAGGGAPRARARRAGWAVPQRGGEGGRTAEPRGFLPAGLASFAPEVCTASQAEAPRRPAPLWARRSPPALCAVRCALLNPRRVLEILIWDRARSATCSRPWCEVTDFWRHLRNVKNARDQSGLVVMTLWFCPAASPQVKQELRLLRDYPTTFLNPSETQRNLYTDCPPLLLFRRETQLHLAHVPLLLGASRWEST